MKKYMPVLEQGADNWSAYVPDLPGCVAAGKTRGETEKLIQEAIDFHLEGQLIDRDALPQAEHSIVESRTEKAVAA